ncbi:type VI secretion system amidase effector protein Tae4 [Massilia sp. TWP1-3-3]|uniref:type VI secretion system amidase effector protein Tae4 n=1 Tax=Massilia sp. TWP1-3-3 TaxID=2804573 RepID=UPI003CF5DB18
MPITAKAGAASASISPRRPSWADMKKYYPDVSVQTPELYDSKIGGAFVKLYAQPGYQNTCAVRMSYALNRSGLKLPKAPSGASVQGGDNYIYWLRVIDLKAELARRFKGADEELNLTVIPNSLLQDKEAMSAIFKTRVKEGQRFIDEKLNSKSGIVVFEVAGWGDATGHFTLWDGNSKKLSYADGHEQPGNNSYYFWLTRLNEAAKYSLVQVVKVKFWELK